MGKSPTSRRPSSSSSPARKASAGLTTNSPPPSKVSSWPSAWPHSEPPSLKEPIMTEAERYDRLDRIIELTKELRQAVEGLEDITLDASYQGNVAVNAIKAVAEAVKGVRDILEKYLKWAIVALVIAVGGSSIITAAAKLIPLIK